MPDPARLAQFDQRMAKGNAALDAIVARVRHDLAFIREYAILARLGRELTADTEMAYALAALAVLRLAKEEL